MITEKLRSRWYNMYKNRVNSLTYQSYFEKRYEPMIQLLLNMNGLVLREEGIGIGSLSKALKECYTDKIIHGFDNDHGMIDLCVKNLPRTPIYCTNILEPHIKPLAHIVTTHGVLEHFEDDDIKTIINRYNKEKQSYVHYVPTDKYVTPTVIGARLLSVEKWLNLVKPKDYILFNNDYDLLLINNLNGN